MDDFNRPLYGDVFGVMQGAEIAVSTTKHKRESSDTV
jgi:splicing factor 3B subunit 2